MPQSSPIRIRQGKCKPTKEDSKKSAAFELVLALYKEGFITTDLQINKE